MAAAASACCASASGEAAGPDGSRRPIGVCDSLASSEPAWKRPCDGGARPVTCSITALSCDTLVLAEAASFKLEPCVRCSVGGKDTLTTAADGTAAAPTPTTTALTPSLTSTLDEPSGELSDASSCLPPDESSTEPALTPSTDATVPLSSAAVVDSPVTMLSVLPYAGCSASGKSTLTCCCFESPAAPSTPVTFSSNSVTSLRVSPASRFPFPCGCAFGTVWKYTVLWAPRLKGSSDPIFSSSPPAAKVKRPCLSA